MGSSVWGKDTKVLDEDVFAPKEEEEEVLLRTTNTARITELSIVLPPTAVD